MEVLLLAQTMALTKKRLPFQSVTGGSPNSSANLRPA